MAYDIKTDYKSIQNALKTQIDAETDAAKKAALQSQYDAAEQSRTEKMASDLTTFGKYATDSELDSAAGIMANNQLGTGYEIQKTNLNTSYDNAKRNANNDALSRGMARSTFVSDRQANLDSERANALSQVDASQALALQNAKTNIIDNYRTNTANALANEKKEFSDTIGAYSDNYQQEINNVTNNNDPSDDWKIPRLQQARNLKIEAQKAAALKAASGGSYGGNGGNNGGGGVDDGGNNGGGGGFNETVIDDTSPSGIVTDISSLRAQGYSNAQIKAQALAAYKAGQITAAQYQMYVQYSGATGTTTTAGGGTR